MCSQKFKRTIVVESCPHTNSFERDQHRTFDKKTLVVWPEASMACRWPVLSKLRSQPDLYCILMSSQASYKTLLNFKATFENFNFVSKNKDNPEKSLSFSVGSIFDLQLGNIVQQIHKTLKQKNSWVRSEPTNQLKRIGCSPVSASVQQLFY